ncbi:flagellar biosynthesis protein FlgB [Asaia sp. W19]|uniref:flagellar basal body rod protein FlgB n=1 Tax=unclassified Asaia TaxID=2685023 RepID=UPI000F8E6DAE|nr:flagellar basal body protein [Asaia sp. W19]RUT26224.1 flagellar biosynthesis protein FlgB [Asaia sp. W19]
MLQALSTPSTGVDKGTDVLDLAKQRMQWLQSRESLIAGNIANANTPGYVARDLPDFKSALSHQMSVPLSRTDSAHLTGATSQSGTGKTEGSMSIDGNRVDLEGELVKIAQTDDQQRMATNAYSTYMSMFSLALGSS